MKYCFCYSCKIFLKTDKKLPEMIKEELLSSLLGNLDENELRINKAVRNASQPNDAIRIITKYELLLKGEKQEDVSNGGQARGFT